MQKWTNFFTLLKHQRSQHGPGSSPFAEFSAGPAPEQKPDAQLLTGNSWLRDMYGDQHCRIYTEIGKKKKTWDGTWTSVSAWRCRRPPPTTTDLSWLVDAALLGASERQLLRGAHHHLAAGQVGMGASIHLCATPCMCPRGIQGNAGSLP